MESNKKLLGYYGIFILGLALIILSWARSYPISLVDYQDFTIKHVYFTYFIGLPLALISLFFIMLNTKRLVNKLFCIFGFLVLFYSINFFYPLLPGPDSHYFRGLTKYFVEMPNWDLSTKSYFQWPGLFISAKVIASCFNISDINTISIMMFLLIGFILTSTLYFIFRSQTKEYAEIITVLYFFIMFYFINYQYAAQSLAIAILFWMIALSLNKYKDNRLWIILLFGLLVITHAFMATFFILYLISYQIFSRLSKNKKSNQNISWKLIFIVLIAYLFYLSFIAAALFNSLNNVAENSALNAQKINRNIFMNYINLALNRPVTESLYLFQKEDSKLINNPINETIYGEINSMNLSQLPKEILDSLNKSTQTVNIPSKKDLFWVDLDEYSQIISRAVVIALIVSLLLGGATLFFQKKINLEILSLGFAGFLYMALGSFIDILGERGIQLIVIPLVCGGLIFLDNKKLKVYLLGFIIGLLFLFPLIVIHSNFDNRLYQELNEKIAADFLKKTIEHQEIDKNSPLFILGKDTTVSYFSAITNLNKYAWVEIIGDNRISSSIWIKKRYDYIFYSSKFKKMLVLKLKFSLDQLKELEEEYDNKYNKIYSNSKTTILSENK